MNMVRCMLKNGLKEFQGDTIICVVYLLNRFTTKNFRRSRQKKHGIFSSVAYAKIQEEKRTKLEDKSQKCILLGYRENLYGYKLYNPMTKKVIMSRDVKFD